jgi:hypothetical protein
MATLYFYASGAGAWDNNANWYTDSSLESPHGAVPTSEDNVILLASVNGSTATAYCNTVVTGSYSIDNVSSMIVTTQAQFQWGTTYTGGITCPDVRFSNGTSHNGSVTGSASFYNSSYMGVGSGGNVSVSASFYDTAYVYDTSGITTWPASMIFYNSSYNMTGIINTNAKFKDSATNRGGTITGTATFTLSSAESMIDNGYDGTYGNIEFQYGKGVNGSSILGLV